MFLQTAHAHLFDARTTDIMAKQRNLIPNIIHQQDPAISSKVAYRRSKIPEILQKVHLDTYYGTSGFRIGIISFSMENTIEI